MFTVASRDTDTEKTEILKQPRSQIAIFFQALWFLVRNMLTNRINTVMITLANIEQDEKNPIKIDAVLMGFNIGTLGACKICAHENFQRFMNMRRSDDGPRMTVFDANNLPEDVPPEVREALARVRAAIEGRALDGDDSDDKPKVH